MTDGREIKITWGKDALRPRTPEEQQQAAAEEKAFRRGYWYGVDDLIEAVRAGATLQELIDHYNGPVWAWHFGDVSRETPPPKFKKPRKAG